MSGDACNVLYAGSPEDWPDYRATLTEGCAARGLAIDLAREHPADEVDYIIYAPDGGISDFRPFSRLKAIFSLWAGVERVLKTPGLSVPLTRMVESGMRESMVEWVSAQVLRHHLGIDRYIHRHDPHWDRHFPPLARDRKVGILGLGELGVAVATALAPFNFRLSGWSRSAKTVPGVRCFHGADGLEAVLRNAEILVVLLPLTPATDTILNAARLDLLPKGAVLINAGRGALIDEDALADRLESGAISAATLDVFRNEPLPADHRFWAIPNLTISPHVAADTRVATAGAVVVENLWRAETHQDLLYRVDPDLGY